MYVTQTQSFMSCISDTNQPMLNEMTKIKITKPFNSWRGGLTIYYLLVVGTSNIFLEIPTLENEFQFKV